MLDLLRTYRLLRTVLALVVMGSVAVPLAAPACAAAMHQQEAVEHEATHERPSHEYPSMERACCCDHRHSQDRPAEAPCPEDEAPEQHHAATPCCTVSSASAADKAQPAAVVAAAPQVPTLTLSRLAVAPLPVVPIVPPQRSANDATEPPELGAVERHVFIATFLI